jgi:MoaA/NifB/PqqE/SkfB family radical SAM enzyme
VLRYLPFAKRVLFHSGPPVHLTLFVTGACNLRCRHCFHWREVREGIPGPDPAQVRRLADSAAELGPLLWVAFAGGEPFLRPDLPELAHAFARHGLAHLSIPTNGLVERQFESIERICGEHPDTFLNVSVSFDGPPDVHDAIRAVPGGHARSCAAFSRMKKLQRSHPNLGVGVILCVTRANQDVLADHLEELVEELEPDQATINLARGDALDRDLLQVDLGRYREVCERKAELQRSGALGGFDHPMQRLVAARDRMMYAHIERVARDGEVESQPGAHLPCTAGTLSAVVFEDGKVAACEMLEDGIGNLNEVDWDLTRLWKTREAQELRDKIRATRCRCTWECAQGDNVLFHARNWPRLVKEGVLA